MMNIEIWGIFHDACITSVSGHVPGDLDLIIELNYIRKQFNETGEAFRLHLKGCDLLTYQSFETNQIVVGLGVFPKLDLEILSPAIEGDILKVITTTGVIRMRYISESIFLDNGRRLDYMDMVAAANLGMHKQ